MCDDHQSQLRRNAYPAGKEIAMKAEPKFHRRGEIRHHRRAARTARAIKPTAAADPQWLERPDGIYWRSGDRASPAVQMPRISPPSTLMFCPVM